MSGNSLSFIELAKLTMQYVETPTNCQENSKYTIDSRIVMICSKLREFTASNTFFHYAPNVCTLCKHTLTFPVQTECGSLFDKCCAKMIPSKCPCHNRVNDPRLHVQLPDTDCRVLILAALKRDAIKEKTASNKRWVVDQSSQSGTEEFANKRLCVGKEQYSQLFWDKIND